MAQNTSGDADRMDQFDGEALGSLNGVRLRTPPGADAPLLELHGENGVTSVRVEDEKYIEELEHTADKLRAVLGE